MNKPTRKDATYISNTLLIGFKKAAGYTNKKFEGIKISFDYEFLIADDIIIAYYTGESNRKTLPINIVDILDCFREKAIENIPNHIYVDDNRYKLYIVPSVLASRCDMMFDIFANAYSVTIPTSCKHGMNIVNANREHSLYEITEFMRLNYVWFWRRDDGPNDCSKEEDDCTLLEYIISILRYI